MDHTEIIDKIFKLRKKYKWTQEKMAGMIGLESKDTLSRWENGKHKPLKIYLRKMEEILGFRPERNKKKIASERIEEALRIMHRLREEKNSGASEKNK